MAFNPLTSDEQKVILHKGTERPGTGEYEHNKLPGTYICRQCNQPLYQSADKSRVVGQHRPHHRDVDCGVA